MKIIIIEPSGALATFQYAHNLANVLAEQKHQVILATGVDFETKDYPRKYEAFEVFNKFIPHPDRILKFLHFVRKLQPDIVHIQGHSHPGSYLVMHYVLKNISNAIIVYTAQDIIPKKKKRHHDFALKKLYSTMSHIFVNATQNKETLLTKFPLVNPDKVTVIPLADLTWFVKANGAVRFRNISEKRKVVLFFGNIEPRKGLLPLIQAFAILRKKIPDAFLLIVGKPFEEISRYISEIDRLGIKEHVLFSGEYLPLKEIPGLFRSSDLVVLPYVEAWNSALIATAYAYGKPVVASNIGGFHEVVHDGKTGLLVPPGDVDALADGISRILGNRVLHEEMVKAVHAEAQLNSWPEIARLTEEVYNSLLKKRNEN